MIANADSTLHATIANATHDQPLIQYAMNPTPAAVATHANTSSDRLGDMLGTSHVERVVELGWLRDVAGRSDPEVVPRGDYTTIRPRPKTTASRDRGGHGFSPSYASETPL